MKVRRRKAIEGWLFYFWVEFLVREVPPAFLNFSPSLFVPLEQQKKRDLC